MPLSKPKFKRKVSLRSQESAEIRKFQKSTELLIRKAPFQRTVKQLAERW